MNLTHINSQSLLHLLSLAEKKEEILQVLERINAEILRTLRSGVSVEFLDVASARAIAAPALEQLAAPKAPAAKPAKAKKAKGGKPGGLKARILALLDAAGDRGLRVNEIAEKLVAKPANISVWFSTTGKKLTKKIEPGRYAILGTPASNKPAEAAPKAAEKPAKSKKRKGGLTAEGRAKLAANMKARWAARKAGKPGAKVGRAAKKGFKIPKAGKNPS